MTIFFASRISPVSLSLPILIVGGGPVGMTVALELGRRNVACVLLNDRPGPATEPKANAISPRSMEHFRRLGLAQRIRDLGLPRDYPADVTYFTRLTGYEIARLRMPGWGEAVAENRRGEGPWAAAEPAQRSSQIFLERALFARLADFPSIEPRFGWRALEVREEQAQVRCRAVEVESGRERWFDGAYLVGCDGGGSVVRKQLGIELEGDAGIVRPFMGGTMLAAHVRLAPAPGMTWPAPSWQYWVVTHEIRALMVAIDGRGEFVMHVQLPEKRALDARYVKEMVERAAGGPALRDIIVFLPWTAGFRLLAQRYGTRRVFIAGDAAHLFTPTGGLGMNTGIDDAVNIAWKLAAVMSGWGRADLLASYEADRRPVGARNLAFSKRFADSVGGTSVTSAIESDTAAGAAERSAIGAHLLRHAQHEFLIPGIHLGLRYAGSPIVWPDGTPEPDDAPNEYHPTARPGHRAPHLWLGPDQALYDRFGRDFTLLCFAPKGTVAGDFATAFAARGAPLAVVEIASRRARELYDRDHVLIGPDQHVMWRGNSAPADATLVAARLCGA